MTEKIEECAKAIVGSDATVIGITSQIGPQSIESHYDEALSVPGVLQAVQRGEREGVDGYVIACFGDPGLDAARGRPVRRRGAWLCGYGRQCGDISGELGVPVVDSVTAATLTVQSLVTMGLRTSKRGEYEHLR
jgi:Asp/Glu/hydantoin racemase